MFQLVFKILKTHKVLSILEEEEEELTKSLVSNYDVLIPQKMIEITQIKIQVKKIHLLSRS